MTQLGKRLIKIRDELTKVRIAAENHAAGSVEFRDGMMAGIQIALNMLDREIKLDTPIMEVDYESD